MREVKDILKTVPKKRKELIHWMAGQDMELLLAICKAKSITMATWQSKYKEQKKTGIISTTIEQAELASLLDGISKVKRGLEGGKTEKDYHLRVLEAKEKAKARSTPATTKIEKNYLQLIHQLRGDKLSWRKIQKYLMDYHHVEFAFSTIREAYLAAYGTEAVLKGGKGD